MDADSLHDLSSTALVPAPTLPPGPPSETSQSTLGLVLMLILIVCSIGFTLIVFRSQLGFHRKYETWVMGWLTIGVFVFLGACSTEWHLHHFRQDADLDAYWTSINTAYDDAEQALESTYGLEIDGTGFVPLSPSEFYDPVEVVILPERTTTTCWFKIVDSFYSVKCGTDEGTAVPLNPPAPEAGPRLNEGRVER